MVDDEELNLRILGRFLQTQFPDAIVVTGSDGHDAIALRFADPPPDLMFVNGAMPEMDGWEAVAAIRAREQADGIRAVPIIFNSRGLTLAFRERALEAGADPYLTLPFDPFEVGGFMRVLLGQSPGTCGRARSGDVPSGRFPVIVTDREWRGTEHPPRSPRGYAHLMANQRIDVAAWRDALARDTPGSADAVEAAEYAGVSLFVLARIVVEAAESGLISTEEAAACMGPYDAAFDTVTRRLKALGCGCAFCVRMSAR